MAEGILFDFNGTMVWDGAYHQQAWNQFCIQLRGRPIEAEEMEWMHGKTNKEIIRLLSPTPISEEESIRLSLAKEALYRRIAAADPAYQLVNGLPQWLTALKEAGIPMTICSASILENIRFFIDFFHLDRWFDPTKIIYDDGTHPDKISMFQAGADILRLPIEHCIVFEDSLEGIRCAKELQVEKIIAIGPVCKHKELAALKGVDMVLSDYQPLTVQKLFGKGK